MKCIEFAFDHVHSLCYKCHKINPNHGESYIDSADWIKNKKAAINSINEKENKCFQYAVTVALNHEEIGKHAEKIKPFINNYKWKGINFPSEKEDQKKIAKNNVTIALIVSYHKKIYAYVSKNNSNCEMQVIFLMIPNGEECGAKSEGRWQWYYNAVKNLLVLLSRITSKNNGDFYYL